MAKTEQASLLPEERIETGYQMIKTDDLPKTIRSTEPDAAMIRSVQSLGILQPILLADRGKGYELLDGRRRLLAARAAGLDKVPCLIALNAAGVPLRRVLTIVANRRRSMNWQSEFVAVEELLGKGYSEQQVADATGIAKNELRRLLRLRKLTGDLHVAFVTGKLTASTAEAAAKLPATLQKQLAKKLAADGKLTAQDVRAVNEVASKAVVESLSPELFAAKPAERNWRETVLDLIDQALATIPPADAETPVGVSLTITLGNAQSLLVPMADGVEQ